MSENFDEKNTYSNENTKKEEKSKKTGNFFSKYSIPIVSTVGITCIALSGAFIFNGVKSTNAVLSDPVKESPYQNISAIDSNGTKWAKTLINTQPPNTTTWNVSQKNSPKHILSYNDCTKIENVTLPSSLLSTYEASGNGITTRIQLYGAGQAAETFNKYSEIIKACTDNPEQATNDTGTGIIKFDKGFVITSGDAIISTTTKNESKREELLEFYNEKIADTLYQSQCLSTQVSAKDAKRSFFYDPESYTGLEETKTLNTQINLTNIPEPTGLELHEINNNDITEPEGPLPNNLPKLPENIIQKPVLPEATPDRTNFIGNAIYQIVDENGPGCGWEWSAQEQPNYNREDLKTQRQEKIDIEQKRIDDEATKYIVDKFTWSFNAALTAPEINKWNIYVKDINNVHEKWEWLNEQRSLLQQPWDTYVANHKIWDTFDERKATAQREYDDAINQCKQQKDEYYNWEREWNIQYTEWLTTKQSEQDRTDKEYEDYRRRKAEDENGGLINDIINKNRTTPEEDERWKDYEQERIDFTNVTPDKYDGTLLELWNNKPQNCETEPERPTIIDEEKPAEPQPPIIPEGVTIPDSWEKP